VNCDRLKIKRVGVYWRIYRGSRLSPIGIGGIYYRWQEIGCGDSWDEAMAVAKEYFSRTKPRHPLVPEPQSGTKSTNPESLTSQ
jgi:hypothetical protein